MKMALEKTSQSLRKSGRLFQDSAKRGVPGGRTSQSLRKSGRLFLDNPVKANLGKLGIDVAIPS